MDGQRSYILVAASVVLVAAGLISPIVTALNVQASPTRWLMLASLVPLALGLGIGWLVAMRHGAARAQAQTRGQRINHDPLTLVQSRAYFFEAVLPSHEGRSGLALIDIDGLAAINAEQGEEAGDAVLKHLGAVLLDTMRRADVVARIEGGTFAILMAGTRPDPAQAALDRLRAILAKTPVPLEAGPLTVTITAGLAELRGPDGAGALAEAREALADAKQESKGAASRDGL